MIRLLRVVVVLLLSSFSAMAVTPALKPASDLLNAGRADDAIRVLESHLKTAPKDAEAYNLLARTYFALQRWDKAIAAGEKASAADAFAAFYKLEAFRRIRNEIFRSVDALVLPTVPTM